MNSSSMYPTFDRSYAGVVRFAARNGYESAVTGIGPVTLGTGVAFTAKTRIAIAASMFSSRIAELGLGYTRMDHDSNGRLQVQALREGVIPEFESSTMILR